MGSKKCSGMTKESALLNFLRLSSEPSVFVTDPKMN